jgi:cell wall-associated NlpC family hydrolase
MLALAVAVLLAAPPPEAGTTAAVVVTAVENMYSGPDAGRDVVSQALLGQDVKVLEGQDGFLRIETPDRYAGWISAGAVLPYATPDAPRYAASGQIAEVTNLMAQVYREPDVTTARPRLQAPLSSRLEVLSGPPPREGWLAVRLPDGQTGYLQAGDARVGAAGAERARPIPGQLVATARRFLGVPYLWGGMSAWGLDCSGFVSQVYRASGRILPRDADLQFGDPMALPVERGDLEPGDLVFFGKTKVTHVGMVVSRGHFIQATTHETPVVQESRLDDPHWVALYKGARRPR